VTRTDGGECRLSDLVPIKSRLTAYDHPIKQVTDVLPVPIVAIGTPP
jgi:hypothetical protein